MNVEKDQLNIFDSATKTKKTARTRKVTRERVELDLYASTGTSPGIEREVREGCVILHFTGRK